MGRLNAVNLTGTPVSASPVSTKILRSCPVGSYPCSLDFSFQELRKHRTYMLLIGDVREDGGRKYELPPSILRLKRRHLCNYRAPGMTETFRNIICYPINQSQLKPSRRHAPPVATRLSGSFCTNCEYVFATFVKHETVYSIRKNYQAFPLAHTCFIVRQRVKTTMQFGQHTAPDSKN